MSNLSKMLGLKFGIESEGFLTNNYGKTCAYAHDWLDFNDKLGCDGRYDTVELRSNPVESLLELEKDIRSILYSYSDSLPDMDLIFAPYAVNNNCCEDYDKNMPCGLHITFSINMKSIHEILIEDFDKNKYKNYFKNKFPIYILNKIEGDLGESRRNNYIYGNYNNSLRIKYFNNNNIFPRYNLEKIDADSIGFEFRLFSSVMSNKDLFFKYINSYMFINFLYLYNLFYNNIQLFSSYSKAITNGIDKLFIELYNEIGNKDFSKIYNILSKNKYKPIIKWWEENEDSFGSGFSLLDSFNKELLINNNINDLLLIDIYDSWDIKSEKIIRYYDNICDSCLRTTYNCSCDEYRYEEDICNCCGNYEYECCC